MPNHLNTSPDLSNPYPLEDRRKAEYRENGFVLLRGVCSKEEVSAYREAITAATYRYNNERRPVEERDTYGRAFLQIPNLWTKEEDVRSFVFAKRFARIAAELMGVKAVRLYHDQALYKEAGGGPTPWHQDFYYWPLDSSNSITLWMPLVDVTEDMGTMIFASGSQKEGYLGAFEISDRSEEFFTQFVAKKGYTLVPAGAMSAGDATFHSGATLHSAPGNTSNATREAMTIIYFADGVKIMDHPDNPNRLRDLQTWFPGVKPGEPAVSSLNPLLYSVNSETI